MKNWYKPFFFHHDILIMFVILAIAGYFSLVVSFSWWNVLFVGVGGFVFTLSEYLTHRFLFHLKMPSNPVLKKLLHRLHYDHHKDPTDLKLLFLPIWYSIPNFFVLTVIFYAIVGSFARTLAFGVGLILVFLGYEWKHYIAHVPIKPRTRFGRWVKKLHLLHHYKNENYWYGVSHPFVDVVFGTLKDEKDVPTSPAARDLGLRE
ncbi:MAG: sterol desaturase family protein [Bacilli bacterium]